MESPAEDRIVLRQRSRRLGRLVLAVIIIACTVAAAVATTANNKNQNDSHPSMRERIACMC